MKDIGLTLYANTGSFESSMKRAANSVKGIQDMVGTLNAAALIYMARQAYMLGEQLFAMAEKGARIKAIEESFVLMAKNSGVAVDSLIKKLKEATRETVDDSDLMKKATRLIVEGFSSEQVVVIGSAARTAARLMGTDVSAAYEQIADSVVNLRERGLKTAGFVIDLEVAYEKHAKTLGVTKEQLNDYGKQMALVTAIGEKNVELQKKLGIESENASEKIQKQKAQWHEIWENTLKAASSVWSYISGLKTLNEMDLSNLFGWGPGGAMHLEAIPAAMQARLDAQAKFFAAEEHGGRRLGGPTKESQIKVSTEYPEWRKVMGEERAQYEKEYWDAQHKIWDIENNLIKVEGERAQQLADDMFPSMEKVRQIQDQMTEGGEKLRAQLVEIQGLVKDFGWEDYAAGLDAANAGTRELTRMTIENTKIAEQAIKAQETWDSIGRDTMSMLSSNMVNLMSTTESWGEKFKKVGESVIQTIMQMIVKQMLLNALFESSEGGGKGFLGKGSGIGGLFTTIVGWFGAEGGITPGLLAHYPIHSYAGGGIARSKQIGIFGEAGEEAFVPLKHGKIPVEGGRGDTYNTFIQATDVGSFARLYGPTIESIYFKGRRYNKVAMR